jgi:hypothetical protein
MTGFDYVITPYGKYVNIKSVEKLERLQSLHIEMMRKRARREIKDDKSYVVYYRDSFLAAYEFFTGGMNEFRKELEKYSGELELFMSEVKQLQEQLDKLENDIRQVEPKVRLTMKHIKALPPSMDKPALQVALKMRYIPLSLEDYMNSLNIRILYFGFHGLSFTNRKWQLSFEGLKGFFDIKTKVFGSSRSEESKD